MRVFLQMDKIRNFSDASEDEDEKVSFQIYVTILVAVGYPHSTLVNPLVCT